MRAGLKGLREYADANQPAEFFFTLFHLLQEQLGERLDVPASSITESIVDERLRPLEVGEEMLALLKELFQACNQARYAPQSTNEELISLIPKTEAALGELRKIKA
jgi:ribosomal protein S18 acetylase RimI-like enzyme